MSERPFAHLHCHTHYSLLDGANRIPDLVKKVKSLGMNACAITDHGNLYGALEFYQTCKAESVNPVLGYEAYIAPGNRTDRSASRLKEAAFHLTLLAMNRQGFQNLTRLASRAFLEGFYYKPRIDKEILAEHHEGIICLSGCASSELSRLLLGEEWTKAEQLVGWYSELFGDRFYMEIQEGGVEIQQSCAEATITLADRMGLPLVATNDAHYLCKEDAESHDVLLCVNTKSFRSDEKRMKIDTDQLFIRSPEQMYAAFPNRAEAVARSQEIANRVDIELDLKTRHFPVFAPPPPKTDVQYLREVALEGLQWRYGDEPGQVYRDRLDFELGVIERMGYASYFLIVWDFARFARDQNIPCTARGSACGAIVSYVLGISDVCPIEYDLLFERFLDPSRTEAPDIDMDFCRDRRELVLNYVKDKYGHANVAQIGTFGTLKAKQAVRDVARALSVPLKRADEIAKMVPETLNIKLEEALEENAELRDAYNADAQTKEVLDFAMALEGLAKSAGTHAAGVVIADRPLIDYVPLQKLSGREDILTQWTDVEKAGLLKMDFLGLRNLSILDKAVANVRKHCGIDIVPKDLPLDDKETFALLQRGETKGIFQLESGGMRDLLTKMRPDKFADIIATSALYRPGPLEGGMVMQYVDVKNGRKQPEKVHPIIDSVLEETYGVMVYQEQVMRILNRLGGIELADSYKCIKAISKKKLDLIAKYREQFIGGAQQNNMPADQATNIFGLIEKFAGYGFNKCVVGDTEIIDASTGQRMTVAELHESQQSFRINALSDSGKITQQEVSHVFKNGKQPTFRLRTRLGKEIVATGNHPFRTLNGWTNLEDLRPDDRIAAPRSLMVFGFDNWQDYEVIVLGGLLSGGNCCHPTCLYFYNDSDALVQDFVAAAEQFDDTVARVDHRADGRRMEVCLSTGGDFRFQPGQKPWNAGGATAVASPPVRSGAFQWAESLGLLGAKAVDKRIPARASMMHDEHAALLLGRLWSGDGFVGAPKQMPFYATSSRMLAQDVQTMLLRLGVVSTVHQKSFKYRYRGTEKLRDGYTVHVVGYESFERFIDQVLPHVVGRDGQIYELLEYRESCAEGERTSRDTIPGEVRIWVDEERRAAQLTWRQLEEQSGVSMKEFVGKGSSLKKGFRRSTIQKLAELFSSRRLTQLAESDIFWDTVESIDPAGIQETYDLTVEEDHNFVANGLIVHNSHSTAYGAIAYQTAYLKAHYPHEFMAALLSCGMESSDRISEHTDDCHRMGIEILPPDVNTSEVEFGVVVEQPSVQSPVSSAKKGRAAKENTGHSTLSTGHEIRKLSFGLGAVKGVGQAVVAAIVAEREANGKFRSIFDLCERVDPKLLSKGMLEILIKAGCLDGFGPHRAQHVLVVDRAVQSALAVQRDKARGQKSLFGDSGSAAATGAGDSGESFAIPPADEWTHSQKLAFEKEVFGFYLTSHPLTQVAEQLAAFAQQTTAQLRDLGDGKEVIVAGMIGAIKKAQTKAPSRNGNSKYVNFDLEDPHGVVRCILWPDDFAREGEKIQAESIVVVKARIDSRGREPNLIVNKVLTLSDAAKEFTRQVAIKFKRELHGESDMKRVKDILSRYPGKTPVVIVLESWLEEGRKEPTSESGSSATTTTAGTNRIRAYLTNPQQVSARAELRQELCDVLGPEGILFQTDTPRNG
jgi:DNA polymerase-3 subunit alpha